MSQCFDVVLGIHWTYSTVSLIHCWMLTLQKFRWLNSFKEIFAICYQASYEEPARGLNTASDLTGPSTTGINLSSLP